MNSDNSSMVDGNETLYETNSSNMNDDKVYVQNNYVQDSYDYTNDNNSTNYYDDNRQSQGKIFLGGLSWDTTEDSLRQYFQSYGEVIDVVVITHAVTGLPRGFGFITMADPNNVVSIVSSQHIIDNKLIDVKLALSRDTTSIRYESKKIFIGGIPAEVTETELQQHFNKYGTVVDTIIMFDHQTCRSRGFGFITFQSGDGIDKCLQSENIIKGKRVDVKRAQPRDHSKSMLMNNNGMLYRPQNRQHNDNAIGNDTRARGSKYNNNNMIYGYNYYIDNKVYSNHLYHTNYHGGNDYYNPYNNQHMYMYQQGSIPNIPYDSSSHMEDMSVPADGHATFSSSSINSSSNNSSSSTSNASNTNTHD